MFLAAAPQQCNSEQTRSDQQKADGLGSAELGEVLGKGGYEDVAIGEPSRAEKHVLGDVYRVGQRESLMIDERSARSHLKCDTAGVQRFGDSSKGVGGVDNAKSAQGQCIVLDECRSG